MCKRLPGLLLLLLLAALAPPLRAAPTVGAGIMLGEPSGGTLKWWVDRDEAWQFGLGLSPLGDASVQAQADYILHIYEIGQAVGLSKTPAYVGLGLRLNGPEDDDLQAGVRLPAGLSHFFPNDPVEVFIELAPVVDLAPRLEAGVNFGVGIRFYR